MIESYRSGNPFTITKAVDLNDNQILQFWAKVPTASNNSIDLARPTSPMPMLLLGGKGSGKTHLMRYLSFELQSLRFQDKGLTPRSGVEADRYIGMYVKCSGLNSGRFSGKQQSDDLWREIFAYYIELWLSLHVLRVANALEVGKVEGDEAELSTAVIALLDKAPSNKITTLKQLIDFIEIQRKELDFQINNCVFTGEITLKIIATRGNLIFGIPKILSERYAFLKEVTFVYAIDEFETLSVYQQRLFNSLVRDRELPTTIRIGARLYGIKTNETDGDQEENLPDSEYELVIMDELFRNNKGRYKSFARDLMTKRFLGTVKMLETQSSGMQSPLDWTNMFETLDESWKSPIYFDVVNRVSSPERRHFQILQHKLNNINIDQANEVIKLLSVPNYPILEKVNILLLYRKLTHLHDAVCVAQEIKTQCESFIKAENIKCAYRSVLDHFISDLAAQLRRENRARHLYLGLDNFITMSGGLPRVLLTTLRSIFDWSTYNGEDSLQSRRISIDAQYRGVREASEWFFNNIRKAGNDGFLIQSATDRLAQIFRTNRFSDRPAECSLNSFSVAEHELSEEARRILKLAENRSFLIRIASGQKHKNSKQVHMKFQLHPMLYPLWQLPLGRRGALPLSPDFANSIFEFNSNEIFQYSLKTFTNRLTFAQGSEQDGELQPGLGQTSLF